MGNSLCKDIFKSQTQNVHSRKHLLDFSSLWPPLARFFVGSFHCAEFFLEIAQSPPQKDNCLITFCLLVCYNWLSRKYLDMTSWPPYRFFQTTEFLYLEFEFCSYTIRAVTSFSVFIDSLHWWKCWQYDSTKHCLLCEISVVWKHCYGTSENFLLLVNICCKPTRSFLVSSM